MMNHRVLVRRSRGIPGVYDRVIRHAAAAAVDAAGMDVPCYIEIMLVYDSEIKALNFTHRQKDAVTDVLSFPSLTLIPGVRFAAETHDYQDGRLFLGEIALSPARAEAQAEEYGHSAGREFMFLTAHSVLHLLGYDHEPGGAAEAEMLDMQKLIMIALGL